MIRRELPPCPPALSSPTTHKPSPHLPATPLAEKPKETPTINGPTRIPLSQRRHTPPKLNLTLDLSAPHCLPSSSSNASKRPTCLVSVTDTTHRTQEKHKSSSKQGIEASSGVVCCSVMFVCAGHWADIARNSIVNMRRQIKSD